MGGGLAIKIIQSFKEMFTSEYNGLGLLTKIID